MVDEHKIMNIEWMNEWNNEYKSTNYIKSNTY